METDSERAIEPLYYYHVFRHQLLLNADLVLCEIKT